MAANKSGTGATATGRGSGGRAPQVETIETWQAAYNRNQARAQRYSNQVRRLNRAFGGQERPVSRRGEIVYARRQRLMDEVNVRRQRQQRELAQLLEILPGLTPRGN